MKRLNSLQIYRGVAAILVVLYHITVYSEEKLNVKFFSNFFSFGFTGVDFFFVLSGFIIFYVHAGDFGHRERLAGYLRRRFNRIYPFYWIVTLAKIIAIFVVSGYAKSYEKEPGVIVKSLLLLPQENLPLIGAAWTLSHEVLFYAIFGVMILLGGRGVWGILFFWSIAIVGLWFGQISGLMVQSPNYLVGFVMNPRNLEFIMGCASAYLVINRELRNPTLYIFAGILLYLAGGIYVDRASGDLSAMSLVLFFGIASFFIVTGSAAIEKKRTSQFPRLLVFLGDASYSIYLGAFAFVNLSAILFFRGPFLSILGPFWMMVLVLVFAIVAGSCVYLAVEKPLLKLLSGRGFFLLKKKTISPETTR